MSIYSHTSRSILVHMCIAREEGREGGREGGRDGESPRKRERRGGER